MRQLAARDAVRPLAQAGQTYSLTGSLTLRLGPDRRTDQLRQNRHYLRISISKSAFALRSYRSASTGMRSRLREVGAESRRSGGHVVLTVKRSARRARGGLHSGRERAASGCSSERVL